MTRQRSGLVCTRSVSTHHTSVGLLTQSLTMANVPFCAASGTTIAGVHELEKAGVRAAFMNAVTVAASKADSLASI